MSVEIVHNQSDFDRVRVTQLQHALDEVSPILACSCFSDFNMTLSCEWFDFDE